MDDSTNGPRDSRFRDSPSFFCRPQSHNARPIEKGTKNNELPNVSNGPRRQAIYNKIKRGNYFFSKSTKHKR